MTESLSVEQTARCLCGAEDVLILCHKNPDGDTVGCGSALCAALHSLGKEAAVLCSDPIPARLAFHTPRLFKGQFTPRFVVAVDVASVQLLGEKNGMDRYGRAVDLCIDHHAGNTGYARATLLDAGAAAVAEPLYEIIRAMGVELSAEIADCLYTGLATDTGCFCLPNTTARTHTVAARLIEAGADIGELNARLFATKTPERMEAERIARDHLEYHLGGRFALLWLTRDEIAASGADPAEMEDLPGLPINVAGVRVGVTLRQNPSGSWRVSIRTAGGVDACEIARRLGGGGHPRAAGCELVGCLENAKAAVLAEAAAALAPPAGGL